MKTFLLRFLLIGPIALAGCQGSSEIDESTGTEEGWTDLFNNENLEGWTQQNGTATYRVEEGVIVGTTAEGSPNSFLCTNSTYADFELEFEVRVDTALNSGVQIRSRTKDTATGPNPDDQPGRVFGPQVEIEATRGSGSESGYVYGEATGHGWLTPEERLKPHTLFKDDEWNHYRIIASGPRIQTYINGESVEDLTHEGIYETHPEGFICLQVHGIPQGAGPYEVRWRNLRIRDVE